MSVDLKIHHIENLISGEMSLYRLGDGRLVSGNTEINIIKGDIDKAEVAAQLITSGVIGKANIRQFGTRTICELATRLNPSDITSFKTALAECTTELKKRNVKHLSIGLQGVDSDIGLFIAALKQAQNKYSITITLVMPPSVDESVYSSAITANHISAPAPAPTKASKMINILPARGTTGTAPAAAGTGTATTAKTTAKPLNLRPATTAPTATTATTAAAASKLLRLRPARNTKLLGDSSAPTIETLNGNPAYMTYTLNGVDWVLPHNRQFSRFINSHFSKYTLPQGKFTLTCNSTADMTVPFPYQELIRDYMAYGTPYRGILLLHGLGSGKSRSAIMAAETFRANGRKILFFGPASLRNNFIEELLKWGSEDIRLPADFADLPDDVQENIKNQKSRIILNSYKFVSSNASNLLMQFAHHGIGHPRKEDNTLAVKKYIEKTRSTLNYPSNMMIIMEEVHNANQTFTSSNAKALPEAYTLFKNAQDCKFIALSATPIINNPFEISTLFNLLRGPLYDGSLLLPENEEEFDYMFMDYGLYDVKNKNRLARTLQGLVSFYRGITSDIEIFPDLDITPDIYVKMSEYQAEVYKGYAKQEEVGGGQTRPSRSALHKAGTAPGAKAALMNKASMEPKSSYRAYTRAASNYVWPVDIPKPLTTPILDFTFSFISDLDITDESLEADDFEHKCRVIAAILGIADYESMNIGELYELISEFKIEPTSVGELLVNPSYTVQQKHDLLTRIILRRFAGALEIRLIPPIKGKVTTRGKDRPFIEGIERSKKAPVTSMPDIVSEYLSDEDRARLSYVAAKKSQRLARSLTLMSKNPDKYFSDDALRMLSPKMLQIYTNIISGKGAMRIVSGPSRDPVVDESFHVKVADLIGDAIPEERKVASLVGDEDDPEDEELKSDQDLEDLAVPGEQESFLVIKPDSRFSPLYKAHPFVYNDVEYQTILHAYYAQKAVDEKYKNSLQGRNPVMTRPDEYANSEVLAENGFTVDDQWEEQKEQILFDVILECYVENYSTHAEKLIETRPKYLFYLDDDPEFGVNWSFEGENLYATILMQVRDALVAEQGGLEDVETLPRPQPKSSTMSADQRALFEELGDSADRHIEGGPSLVYSVFAHGEGVGIFSKILEARGYEKFEPSNYDFSSIHSMSFHPRYTVISGDVDMDDRSQLMKFFNHPINRHGQLIRIILVTSAASEGISLRFVRQVHIMEPFWHNVRISQVIGRARRLCSHTHLPPDQRIVHVFKYYSVYNLDKEGKPVAGGGETDLYLKELATNKEKVINNMMKVMYSASIDCVLNSSQNKPEELGYTCFNFAEGDDEGMAYAGHGAKDVTVAKKIHVVEEKLAVLTILEKKFSYKTDNKMENGIPRFTEKIECQIDISRDPSLKETTRSNLSKYTGTLLLIPLYDYDQAKSGVLTRTLYILNLGDRRVPFPLKVVVPKK